MTRFSTSRAARITADTGVLSTSRSSSYSAKLLLIPFGGEYKRRNTFVVTRLGYRYNTPTLPCCFMLLINIKIPIVLSVAYRVDINPYNFTCSVKSETMRLTTQEVSDIKNTAQNVFGPTVEVRLFGSRVNDNARGGDIDLYLLVDPERYTLQHELRFELDLLKKLGERRIDVLVRKRGDETLPIDEIALATGVLL